MRQDLLIRQFRDGFPCTGIRQCRHLFSGIATLPWGGTERRLFVSQTQANSVGWNATYFQVVCWGPQQMS